MQEEARTPLVGRKREVEVLTSALARVLAERSPQLVTLVGVPGIGKSRLVYELMRHIEAGGELVAWRQGRSLPYGEGIPFWALGEIVKAEAGILESDDEATVAGKLERTVAQVIEGETDAAWIAGHLRRLVGLATETELSGDRRDESFTAWRRFLEALAERRPLVLVFEDLHWADDGLLDFVDELPDWTSGVRLLVVCTARPELLDRRPGWGGGKLNATTLALSPLPEEETARLIAGVLERSVLPAETQATLVERAGGNPLYAEQFARLYLERGSADELPLPETLQGLIAARLDGLSAEDKALLQDAAVLGKVFWLGALRRAAPALARTLNALERKGFVRRERRSAVEGEQQYVFPHLLVRDVAYGQIPRAERAEKHRLAAEWIESLGRPEDHAEMLAHHYLAALELSRAAGRPAEEVSERARRALRDAGERAFALNAFSAAGKLFSQALDLSPDEERERAELLLRFGRALHLAGDDRSSEVLEQAAHALHGAQEPLGAAEAYALLGSVWSTRGQSDTARAYMERAAQLVADAPPTAAKASVLVAVAGLDARGGKADDALAPLREALAIAERHGLTELAGRALTNLGLARHALGEPGAIHDLERAVELLQSVNSPAAVIAYNNLSVLELYAAGVRRSTELSEQAIALAERLGNPIYARHVRGNLIGAYFQLGDWDEALRRANEFIAEADAGPGHYMGAGARRWRGRIRLGRGEPAASVLEDLARALELSRVAKDPQVLVQTLSVGVWTFAALARRQEAHQFANELVAALGDRRGHVVAYLLDFLVVARELGYADEVAHRVRRGAASRWRDAAEALLAADYSRAADLLDECGDASRAADARLRAARALVDEGRRAEAEAQLEKALSFYRSVDARRFIREGEQLLAATA